MATEKAARYDPNAVIKEVRNVGKKIDALSTKIDKMGKANNVGWFDSDSVTAIKELTAKFDKYVIEDSKGDKELMTAIKDLETVVQSVADEASQNADSVTVAVDLIKEMVSALGQDNPKIVEAVAKLEAIRDNLNTSQEKLQEAAGKIMVSGGLVYPKEENK